MKKIYVFLMFLLGFSSVVAQTDCGDLYIQNSTGQELVLTGVYPDTQEALHPISLPANISQQSIALSSLQSCAGNTPKVHCNVMRRLCHPALKLTITMKQTGTILFSGVVHPQDLLVLNHCDTCKQSVVVFLNEIQM